MGVYCILCFIICMCIIAQEINEKGRRNHRIFSEEKTNWSKGLQEYLAEVGEPRRTFSEQKACGYSSSTHPSVPGYKALKNYPLSHS